METNKYDEVRELLNRVHQFLSNLCRDARCDDHCSECIGASDLADDVYDLLHSPRRNCDVGTAEEIDARWNAYCEKRIKRENCMSDKNCKGCSWRWAQTPYEAQEGGAE